MKQMTNSIQAKLEMWRLEVEEILNHPILFEHTGKPRLSDLRMASIYLPLLDQDTAKDVTAYHATAIIYLALSCHDHVLQKGTLQKSQQLQVLAGDYYSGKYYQLLAENGYRELITRLTDSIRLMTESRSFLYLQDTSDGQAVIHARKVIVTEPTRALFTEMDTLQLMPLTEQLALFEDFDKLPYSLEWMASEINQQIEQAPLSEEIKNSLLELIEQALPSETIL